jgi:hypothetical protein
MSRSVKTPVEVWTTTPGPLNPLKEAKLPAKPIVGLPETPSAFVSVMSADELAIRRATAEDPLLEIKPLPAAIREANTPLGVIVMF